MKEQSSEDSGQVELKGMKFTMYECIAFHGSNNYKDLGRFDLENFCE